ncbi:MAG TPA: hypothetical protein VF590_18460, partial [Isosphaeraceae bacterium]
MPELPSGRESFCADVSYDLGPWPENPMEFIKGPSTLAAEVRGEHNDEIIETERAAKRADSFAAGTLVVWDVNPIARRVHVYRA